MKPKGFLLCFAARTISVLEFLLDVMSHSCIDTICLTDSPRCHRMSTNSVPAVSFCHASRLSPLICTSPLSGRTPFPIDDTFHNILCLITSSILLCASFFLIGRLSIFRPRYPLNTALLRPLFFRDTLTSICPPPPPPSNLIYSLTQDNNSGR